jgi:hypothetical protein
VSSFDRVVLRYDNKTVILSETLIAQLNCTCFCQHCALICISNLFVVTVSEFEKCVGGLPSLKTLMDDPANRNQRIWLNAGNTLGGDLFRTLKFGTAIRAMNLLNFSATVR